MNGDGFADIVAGEPDYLVDAGRAHIILGGKTGLTSADSWTIENGRPDQGRLGLSVAGGSDLNADGFSDVIIGVPGSDGGNGSARAYLGSPSGLRTGLEWRIVGMIGVPGGWGLGRTVSAGADLDGDGYGDVAVSYFSHSESGPEMGIRVYLGSKSGFRTSDRWSLQPGSDEFAIMQGTGSEPPVGWVVGGLLSETGESAIKIVPATPEGLQLRSALEVVGGNSSSPPDLFRTGIVVSSAGDINRDGVPDVIVGEPAFENGTGRVDILLLGKEDIPPGKADSEWQRGMIVVVAVSSAAIVLLVGYLARRRRRLRQGPRAADPPQTGRTTDTGRKKHR